MQDLVDISDPDWAKFKEGDEEYYLDVAGDAIRRYCGWHIFPSVTETVTKLMIESFGMITLPSLYVTDVASVVMEGRWGEDPTTVDPSQYVWFQEGRVQMTTAAPGGFAWGWPGAYFYGPEAPYYLPVYNFGLADVTMTHGYDVLPGDIKQVAFELAKSSTTLGPTGLSNVKEIASPQYKTVFGTAPGVTLNDAQKNRLANFKLGGFK